MVHGSWSLISLEGLGRSQLSVAILLDVFMSTFHLNGVSQLEITKTYCRYAESSPCDNGFIYIWRALQCIIPVIEELFPKGDNKIILDLLYTLAEWHSYAKLRLHTESTLQDFEDVTKRLCDLLRKFKRTVCRRYITKELPREINARGRRTARLAAQGKAPPKGRIVGARNVEFNMNTYKMHALPDYPLYVRALGTTDNYTTQMVCLPCMQICQWF